MALFPRRPPLGPGVIAKLRAVDGIGLTDVEMDSALTLVLGYVRDASHAPAARPGAVHALAMRVGTAATTHYNGLHDAEHAFEFGLARVLDGIEAFVRGK